MDSVEQILDGYGKQIVADLRNNMAKKKLDNTGNTSRSIRYEVSNDTLFIYAEEHILALNDGAKAISKRTDGGFIDAITKWAQSKLNLPINEAKGLAFGYLRNRTGQGNGGLTTDSAGNYLVPNRFNSGGVLSDTLNDTLIDSIQNDVSLGFENMIVESFAKFVKDGTNSN